MQDKIKALEARIASLDSQLQKQAASGPKELSHDIKIRVRDDNRGRRYEPIPS